MTKLVNVETGEIVPTLEGYEAIIQAGLATFIEVGEALAEIRDRKLYRKQGFKTFDDYCSQRWEFSARRAGQMMEAAEIGTMVPISNERQARALAPLKNDPKKMAAALTDATEQSNGKPTAAAIEDAVRAIQHHEPKAPDADAARTALTRSCKELAQLPRGAAFLDLQGDALRDRHRTYVEDAYAWLGDLLDEWGHR